MKDPIESLVSALRQGEMNIKDLLVQVENMNLSKMSSL
jgi:hypothetical protein